MHMLKNLMISVGVNAADVWPPTVVIPTLQHHFISQWVERGKGNERYFFKYTRPAIYEKLLVKNYNIIMNGKGQKG